MVAGLGLAYAGRWSGPVGLVIGFLSGFVIAFVVITLSRHGAASLVGMILNPSGESTPSKADYSYPQSLTERGHYEEAIAAYRVCRTANPEDPEPYLGIARLYRDRLEAYDEALLWFKRARSESALTRAREMFITREIIELYTQRIGDPQRAIPELARLVDRFPHDPVSEWAKKEIVRFREASSE